MRRLSCLLALLLLPLAALADPAAISPAALRTLQADGQPLAIVDVRSAEEYATGHIPGAINIPHDQIAGRAAELAAFRDGGRIVLYCRSGRRALLAAGELETRGYSGLLHLEGDLPGWQQDGGPVTP